MAAAPSRIVIIDDEEVVLDACTEILADGPYTVATAPDGAIGLRRVQEVEPDLVFVDLKMPGLSGMEVIERIRAHDPTIVTIVITGYASLGAAVEAMQRGAYDFVAKPFTPDEFRLITRRGLERRRLAVEAATLRQEREVLREQFAAIVSHELKGPLAAIQQNLMLLAHELSGGLTEGQRTRLERLQVRIDDLLKMVGTWLRAFTTDLSRIREQFVPTPLAPVIAKAIETVGPMAGRKAIEVVASSGDPPRVVLGDAGALTEAVVNLLGNAVKYSPSGGRVTVEATGTADRVVVAVRDCGVGIPPDELPHIFADFYRGRAGREGGGAGLGLALTRRIVEAHDGTITAESAPGRGSTFVITLPALHAGERAPAPPDARPLENSLQGGAV